jgi:hypothetical protein
MVLRRPPSWPARYLSGRIRMRPGSMTEKWPAQSSRDISRSPSRGPISPGFGFATHDAGAAPMPTASNLNRPKFTGGWSAPARRSAGPPRHRGEQTRRREPVGGYIVLWRKWRATVDEDGQYCLAVPAMSYHDRAQAGRTKNRMKLCCRMWYRRRTSTGRRGEQSWTRCWTSAKSAC